MKKRFVSLCLAGLIMVAPASAVFTDISDSRVSQTAAVLDALGIMQGVGGGSFAPGKALTRAQFCKLAVTAMGVTDVSPYASYTIFPDVKHSHWAAPYINAAVRHPELKEKSIIRGYADGSFGPNKIVSYGEVCTMLLRMLGYKEEDVGPFWPADYIAQAQAIGLTDGVTITDARAAVKRGDAAVLLLNALNTDKKGEEGSTLLDKVASSTVKDCILLETGKTHSGLAADAALFYEDGVVDVESPRKTAGTLDSSMIGVYGTIVIGKGSSKVAVGVIPNGNKTETYEVVNAEADRIVTTNGTLRPDRKTKLYISRDHVMNEYENAWANLQSGDTLTLYYNEYGVLQLMAVLPKTTAGATHAAWPLPRNWNVCLRSGDLAQDSGGVYDHQKRCEDRREQAEKIRCCDARCRKPSGDRFGYQAERKISDRLDNVQPSLSGGDSGKEILGFLRGGGNVQGYEAERLHHAAV